ncbi:unnamed protein product [Enterobius vermicularis]|uniref:Restriction endonuclease n=1 Tax=Enterobius vermicularis TaxID=51028 RepID=A0A0N4UZ80_ENTVE|nr:unnamed protein product [Enterobius vermicularis]
MISGKVEQASTVMTTSSPLGNQVFEKFIIDFLKDSDNYANDHLILKSEIRKDFFRKRLLLPTIALAEDGSFQDIERNTSSKYNTISFLKNATAAVAEEFVNVWNDDNIASESLRDEKIHRLAVSLLTSQQLLEYNAYATKKKNRARIREHLALYRSLSTPAKKALRYLTRVDSSEQLKFARDLPRTIQKQLKHFAIEQQRIYDKNSAHYG